MGHIASHAFVQLICRDKARSMLAGYQRGSLPHLASFIPAGYSGFLVAAVCERRHVGRSRRNSEFCRASPATSRETLRFPTTLPPPERSPLGRPGADLSDCPPAPFQLKRQYSLSRPSPAGALRAALTTPCWRAEHFHPLRFPPTKIPDSRLARVLIRIARRMPVNLPVNWGQREQ
jgi:hypothetical protein